jgi:hypothetical protein
MAAKPKVYGDKTEVAVTGPNGGHKFSVGADRDDLVRTRVLREKSTQKRPASQPGARADSFLSALVEIRLALLRPSRSKRPRLMPARTNALSLQWHS